MASNVLPTLGISGWVSALSEKADRLFAYFFETDGLQSSLYRDRVYSLPKIIKDFAGDESAITRDVQKNLTNYLLPYFDAVEVQTDHQTDAEGKVNIKLYAKVSENGKEYSLGKLIVLADNKISKILDLNN